jgi:ABC-type multidrug transport system fused ATPase/permease subunit
MNPPPNQKKKVLGLFASLADGAQALSDRMDTAFDTVVENTSAVVSRQLARGSELASQAGVKVPEGLMSVGGTSGIVGGVLGRLSKQRSPNLAALPSTRSSSINSATNSKMNNHVGAASTYSDYGRTTIHTNARHLSQGSSESEHGDDDNKVDRGTFQPPDVGIDTAPDGTRTGAHEINERDTNDVGSERRSDQRAPDRSRDATRTQQGKTKADPFNDFVATLRSENRADGTSKTLDHSDECEDSSDDGDEQLRENGAKGEEINECEVNESKRDSNKGTLVGRPNLMNNHTGRGSADDYKKNAGASEIKSSRDAFSFEQAKHPVEIPRQQTARGPQSPFNKNYMGNNPSSWQSLSQNRDTHDPFARSNNENPSSPSASQTYKARRSSRDDTRRGFANLDDDEDDTLLHTAKRMVLHDIPQTLLAPFYMVASKILPSRDDGQAYLSFSFKNQEVSAGWHDDAVSRGARGGIIGTMLKPFSFLKVNSGDDDDGNGGSSSPESNRARRGTPSSYLSLSCVPAKVDMLVKTVFESDGQTLKRYPLISDQAASLCHRIGTQEALFDVVSFAFMLAACLELMPAVPSATSQRRELSSIVQHFVIAMQTTWAPFAFAAAWLTSVTCHVLYEPVTRQIRHGVEKSISSTSDYAQLWLRLVSSLQTDSSLPTTASKLASSYVRGLTSRRRLQSFTAASVGAMIIMSFKQEVFVALSTLASAYHNTVAGNQSWRRLWPVDWVLLWQNTRAAMSSLLGAAVVLWKTKMGEMEAHPILALILALLLVSLVINSLLPNIAYRCAAASFLQSRRGNQSPSLSVRIREESSPSLNRQTVLALGGSSASRIHLAASNDAEALLDKYSIMRPTVETETPEGSSSQTLSSISHFMLGMVALLVSVISGLVLLLPVIICVLTNTFDLLKPSDITSIGLMLAFVFSLTHTAIFQTINFLSGGPLVIEFVLTLKKVMDEIRFNLTNRRVDPYLSASASSTKGVVIHDFWTAHAAKRAWALQCATFSCMSGEVVVVLGDDGAGKTRLLTSVAEHIFQPPRQSRSTMYVRGTISVGGVDVNKWDPHQLRNKCCGVWLNDLASVSQMAESWSGSSLEDILDPHFGQGIASSGPLSKEDQSNTRNSVRIALEVSGDLSRDCISSHSKLLSIIVALCFCIL